MDSHWEKSISEKLEEICFTLEIDPGESTASASHAAYTYSNLASTSTSFGFEPETSVQAKTPLRKHGEKKQKKKIKKKSKYMPCDYAPSQNFRTNLETIFEDVPRWNPSDEKLLLSFIKNDDLAGFSEFIWNCPHLLYFDDALPLAEIEGVEYNLLQISILFNSPVVCQLILDILEHPLFCFYLFPPEGGVDYSSKMFNIFRLYVNSGIKQNGDTPLHLASKLGFLNCCIILLSHPLCERSKTNYDGFKPSDVICKSACGAANPSFKDLQELFKDAGFVKAQSDNLPKIDVLSMFSFLRNNADFTGAELREVKTRRFYNAVAEPRKSSWYTPQQRGQLSKIKYFEPNRGIERIGRTIAYIFKIQWREFVPFLNVFTNLNSVSGMRLFEKYWIHRWADESPCSPLTSSIMIVKPEDLSLSLIHLYPTHVNPLSHRANLLYCYFNKFMKAGIELFVEEEEVADKGPLPSPLNELERRHDIYMNGSHLSDLDKELYMALMPGFPPHLYPATAIWKRRMEDRLHSESLKAGNFGNIGKCDPLRPTPVPYPHDF